MFTRFVVFLLLLASARAAVAQGIMGDVFSGKLINPEPGVFAWYDLTDTATGKQFYLRLAIVGEEKVKGKTGYWFEVELLPRVGFPSVYKLLLTGPASDSKNVHRIMMKEGNHEPVELDNSSLSEGSDKSASADRREVGQEDVETQAGSLNADHVVVEEGGVKTDIWLNNEVRPMGLVKMSNAQGELVLKSYGNNGSTSGSMFDNPLPKGVIDEPVKAIPSKQGTPEAATVTDSTTPIATTETTTTETPATASTQDETMKSETPTTPVVENATAQPAENPAAISGKAKSDDKSKKKSSDSKRRGVGGKR